MEADNTELMMGNESVLVLLCVITSRCRFYTLQSWISSTGGIQWMARDQVITQKSKMT